MGVLEVRLTTGGLGLALGGEKVPGSLEPGAQTMCG